MSLLREESFKSGELFSGLFLDAEAADRQDDQDHGGDGGDHGGDRIGENEIADGRF